MHDPDRNGTQRLVEARAAEPAIEFGGRDCFLRMSVRAALVSVGVAVDIIPVAMRVLVIRVVAAIRAYFIHGAQSRAQVERAEEDEHERDAKLETHPETFGDDDAEKNDGPADDKEGEAMADAPEESGPGRASNAALPAHDRRDRDDVIGIGRVPHAKEEAKKQDGKERGHVERAALSAWSFVR